MSSAGGCRQRDFYSLWPRESPGLQDVTRCSHRAADAFLPKAGADLFGKIVKRIESNDYSGGICRHFIVKNNFRPCEPHLLFICGSYIKAAVAQIIKIPVSSVIMRTKSPHPTVDMPLKATSSHSSHAEAEVQPVFVGYLRRCDDFHFRFSIVSSFGRCEFFPG